MDTPNFPYKISVATDAEKDLIDNKIDAFNAEQLSLKGKLEDFDNYVVKDNDTIIAGITTCFYLNEILYIGVLFVDEKYRHQGLGRFLLNKVETEATAKGAKLVHLDTFDFQAKDFYLKYGYEVFGTLENCPQGHKRYYMKKELS